MSDGARIPQISRPALFARMADGPAADIAVVTPNRRLAQELAREFDAFQIARGRDVWEAGDILPLDDFVERLYQDASYSGIAVPVPQLLAQAQQQELWLAAIRESEWSDVLLSPAPAAADCMRAWELAHRWRMAAALQDSPGNEDATAFLQWARDYARRCEREDCTDGARLPDVVMPLLGEHALRKPRLLVAYAFDVVTPQAREFLEACAACGIELKSCLPERRTGTATKVAFSSTREELQAAAQWARARLEFLARGADAARMANIRIGIVVPELAQRRKEVTRVFTRVMQPDSGLPGAQRRPPPFNISLGEPLADVPLVRAALSILELACGEIRFEQASRLVRSPFLGGAETEMAARARLDADLRTRAPAHVALGKLIGLCAAAPDLRRRLEALFAGSKQCGSGERSLHDWSRRFSGLLAAVGFPGERSLDSAEYQAHARFNELLAELAKLGRVAPHMGFAPALARLRHLCADALFQPESGDAPVQVLGVLESSGLCFDALWVSGLTDEAWPLRAKPNPFIPPALQRGAGIPEASAEATLARAERITAGWLSAADEVIVSYPAMEEDRALIVSPLIATVSEAAPEALPVSHPLCFRDALFALRTIETLEDGRAPALATTGPRGGTRILADQAACPFRAFARHRLAAESLEEPVDGPDSRTRGLLLHVLMQALWNELRDSEALHRDCGPAIEKAAAAAVAQARLEEPFAALERTRLARLAREWLDIERTRAPFEVAATESRRRLRVAGLDLSGRIDRLDRLASGGHALIDYKSGRVTPNEWTGARPDDPQLPLYAVSAEEDIAAVAFAKLKTGEMRYMGFSRNDGEIPGVNRAQDWDALLESWKREIESLGAAFAAGDARVDPKHPPQTCVHCGLQPLCRVHERSPSIAGDEGDAAGED